jgi:2-dehydro-3-deoxyphosphogluconate aldolase/(4S)-4-hydroxy-2-oxoglutarate aldolase
MREDVIKKTLEKKIVVIVRGVFGEDCVKLAQALYEGGIELLEVTFDQSKPEAFSRTADTIRQLVNTLGDKMIFGAGTVTSVELVHMAKEAGAQFIVSPDTNEQVIRATVEEGMVSMPGAMTPTEIVSAHSYGADFIKVFPIGNLGASYLKAVKAPLNHIKMLAVGGVTEKNIGEYMEAGADGAGVGGQLVNKEWIANGEFDKITALAKEFVKIV